MNSVTTCFLECDVFINRDKEASRTHFTCHNSWTETCINRNVGYHSTHFYINNEVSWNDEVNFLFSDGASWTSLACRFDSCDETKNNFSWNHLAKRSCKFVCSSAGIFSKIQELLLKIRNCFLLKDEVLKLISPTAMLAEWWYHGFCKYADLESL